MSFSCMYFRFFKLFINFKCFINCLIYFLLLEIVEEQEGNEDFNYFQLLQLLVEQDIPNLPPGGGLPAK